MKPDLYILRFQNQIKLVNSLLIAIDVDAAIQELRLANFIPVAVERLKRLTELQPDNERAHFNLGMLAADRGAVEEAERGFRKAVTLNPAFRSALFNLALLLADAGRPLEAQQPLQQLLQHHPTHVKGLILLGDIYTNHQKDLDRAEHCYKRLVPTSIYM